jgi:hypothetical protein
MRWYSRMGTCSGRGDLLGETTGVTGGTEAPGTTLESHVLAATTPLNEVTPAGG